MQNKYQITDISLECKTKRQKRMRSCHVLGAFIKDGKFRLVKKQACLVKNKVSSQTASKSLKENKKVNAQARFETIIFAYHA